MSDSRTLIRGAVTSLSVVVGVIATMLASGSAWAAAPSAPSGLAVTGQTVSWVDGSTDETGFAIEWCAGSGCTSFGQIATVAAGVTAYTDTFMVTSMNRYRVRAFNADGYSSYSDIAEQSLLGVGQVFAIASASPVSGTAPLTVTFDGSASSDLMGVAVTSHTWRFGDDQTATGAVVSHTYAKPGVYAASLRVTGGSFNNSADSTSVLITVTAPPLVAPSNLAATSPSRGRVVLTWTNPPSSATSLAVERCKGSTCTNFTRIATLAPTATSYTDTAVSRGATYAYRLAATDGGATVYSNRVVVTARK